METRSLLAVLVADALSGTASTTVTGTVYEDVNSNGVRDGGENGIKDWTVYLDLDNSGTFNTDATGVLEPSTVTNNDGDYVISNLKPGTYRLAEVVPAGWTPTSPMSQDVTVIEDKDTKAYFFAFGGGSIVGTVWNDLDQNGTRATDSAGAFTEPGLAGWTVFLDVNNIGVMDADEPQTVTDSEGRYSFTNLPPGDYEVTEVLPDGWDIPDLPGFDTKQTAGVKRLGTVTQDFANFSLVNGSLRGTIWNDLNADGVRDTNPDTGEFVEPALAGWTVFLDLNHDGAQDPLEPATVTNENGDYAFVSLAEGTYDVTEVMPDGWYLPDVPGFDTTYSVDVSAGSESIAPDFANFTILNGSIRGVIWNDLNRNGVRDTSLSGAFKDPGLASWSVFLDLNRNGVADAGEPATLTGADGSYSFTDLQVGDYDVLEVLPSGWETAPTFGDNVTVAVYSGVESVAPDFANFNVATASPSSVSGTVWNDLNGNGVRDASDAGLAGWTVFADLNSNGTLDAVEPSATSATDGAYSLSGLTVGSVSIVEVATAGWRATAPPSRVRALSLKNGDNVVGVDFGNAELKDSSIGGGVFADADKNGVRGTGERGLAGITVYLDLNNDSVLDPGEPQTMTSSDLFYTPDVDEAGAYSFTHLAKGTYTVRTIVTDVLSATPASELTHTVTLVAAEDRTGVNSAAVFRANEIHGVKFDDVDGDHQRDAGEPVVAGATIFIDLNRNDVLDVGEPTTETDSEGSYAFADLKPGAYVVRSIAEAGYEHSFPTTAGGILWPSGDSHPAVGDVTPTSITTSLATGEIFRQTVSLALPNSGALTNLVDVFLLFDDTGSFTNNSPIVRAAFPDIITQLQGSLPGIDLGFGVGRLEEYGGFAYEYATGRPFVLNQPIVAASTSGYLAAIQAALNRTTPGYGGDQPETDIEALYQLVTGHGFDGNNNGSVLDSGAAGLASTQLNPGGSGDVPSFASFQPDPANNVLPAAGTVGGAGFRAGALPIILLATDTGFAYQPKGESTITGLGGLNLSVGSFTQTSRPTTPFNSGAGIQETITALNALGALVIGLGTNPQATLDPRQGLEAVSKLTGATNQSTTTIANGTADAIAPGDPLYFQIASGFAGSVANGVVSAIQNAVTNVAVNITVQASDPRVHIINHTGVRSGVTAGQTATFDIEFVGDGVPHRFDLQFVRQGTNVVLGSIPVVIGTPIPGSGYEFEDLEEGEIEREAHFADRLATPTVGNVAPSFTKGADQVVFEDAAMQSVSWATNVSAGPESESSQSLEFIVISDKPALFAVQPAISADGTLTYTPATNAFGATTVTVRLRDNGGTEGGGADTSDPQTFSITLNEVNDAPVALADSYATDEDVTLTVAAAGVLGNDSDVDGDALQAVLVSGPANGSLSLDAAGSFVYTPTANFHGNDSFTYQANDGSADSNIVAVNITVNAVNDAPVALGDSYATDEDVTLTVSAAGVLGNDSDVDGDALQAVLVSGPANGTLSLDAAGSFVYTPTANFHGNDSFTYQANDGSADSNIVAVNITVNAVNDAPVALGDSYTTAEGATLTVSAAGVLGNDVDVDGDALTAVLVSGPANGTLSLDAAGSFVYTPTANFHGSDSFTYQANDGSADSDVVAVNITVNPKVGATKFFVVDSSSRSTFEYDATGNSVATRPLNKEDATPRGITSNKTGTNLWVLDKNGVVFVYDNAGHSLGSWEAKGAGKSEGITTDGQSIWIVDADSDKVLFYANAAARRSGSAVPSFKIRLDRANRDPKDIATDGKHLWVVNDTSKADTVFRYTVGGKLEGSWQIDRGNSKPTGLTIDPNNVNDLWVVDAGADAVFQYQGGALRRSGSQAADAVFALAAGNKDPQGIVDPSLESELASNWRQGAGHSPSSATQRVRDVRQTLSDDAHIERSIPTTRDSNVDLHASSTNRDERSTEMHSSLRRSSEVAQIEARHDRALLELTSGTRRTKREGDGLHDELESLLEDLSKVRAER